MQFGKPGGYGGLRWRWSLGWALLMVALGSLLSGCVEVMSSPAPRPEVVTGGLGATRREWDHEHKVTGSFERELGPVTLKGLVYDGKYRVAYWVDGPQEVAPASARISRIEFDTPERDPETWQALAHELLPDDAILNNFYGPSAGTGNFTEIFISPSLDGAYKPLAYTERVLVGGRWSWVGVSYSTSTPNVVIQVDPWSGIPPEYVPPVPTLPVPSPVPSVGPQSPI